jgi:hypothetical protein
MATIACPPVVTANSALPPALSTQGKRKGSCSAPSLSQNGAEQICMNTYACIYMQNKQTRTHSSTIYMYIYIYIYIYVGICACMHPRKTHSGSRRCALSQYTDCSPRQCMRSATPHPPNRGTSCQGPRVYKRVQGPTGKGSTYMYIYTYIYMGKPEGGHP